MSKNPQAFMQILTLSASVSLLDRREDAQTRNEGRAYDDGLQEIGPNGQET
jgi:hypothetical protein